MTKRVKVKNKIMGRENTASVIANEGRNGGHFQSIDAHDPSQ